MTYSKLKSMLSSRDIQLFDVRNPDEYQAGRISDAVNIPCKCSCGCKLVLKGAFLWVFTLLLYEYQWGFWKSLSSCPHSSFNTNLKWGFLGRMMTTLCFTAEVATGVLKHSLLLISLDSSGKNNTFMYTINIPNHPLISWPIRDFLWELLPQKHSAV